MHEQVSPETTADELLELLRRASPGAVFHIPKGEAVTSESGLELRLVCIIAPHVPVVQAGTTRARVKVSVVEFEGRRLLKLDRCYPQELHQQIR